MQYRALGRTGLQVSTVGLGTNQFGRVIDEAGVRAILDRAVELGVNFVDTAESYGDGASERLLGKALRGRRREFIVATKTGWGSGRGRLTRQRIMDRLDASLDRLATDYVDLYYLHSPDDSTPLEESLRAFEDAIRSGKTRYVGISNHAAWQVAEAVGISERHDWSPVCASQMEYSLVERAVEREMMPACEHLGVSLVPYYPLAGGFLTGKYEKHVPPPANSRFGRTQQQPRFVSDENFEKLGRWRAFAGENGRSVGALAIAWLLAHPVVCSVIAGVTSAEQLSSNVAADTWTLVEGDVSAL
jgi:aryl-alcohol dehydrogenase-like predicted oxidoreductase